MEDGVEAIRSLQIGQVPNAREDFKPGVGDRLLHLRGGIDVGVAVFRADDDKGRHGDASQGWPVVLALGTSPESCSGTSRRRAGDHSEHM